MNPKIQKLRAELNKNNEKISKLQSRNTEIKQQIRELEDTDIIGMVRPLARTMPMMSVSSSSRICCLISVFRD